MKKNTILLFTLFSMISVEISSQVTIGSDEPPHKSAILDLTAPNKGFLGPRVRLLGRYDNTTIPDAVPGLLVLNISQPDLNQDADERVYPYRFYYRVGGDNPRWERFIGQDELEYKLDREISKLAIPRPAMFYLDGKDILSNNRPGVLNFMSNISANSAKNIPLMDSINHTGGSVQLQGGKGSTIIFEPGILYIVFSYLFIPTAPINITCNVSSYFMDFPFYHKPNGNLKRVRVYSSTYHNTRDKSSHAATINFVATIKERTEWIVQLGAGHGDCTRKSGFSLPNRNTFLYITKVGDW